MTPFIGNVLKKQILRDRKQVVVAGSGEVTVNWHEVSFLSDGNVLKLDCDVLHSSIDLLRNH